MYFLFYIVFLVKIQIGKGKEMKNKFRLVNLLKKGKINCIYFWKFVKFFSVVDVCYLICIFKIIGVFFFIYKYYYLVKFVCYSFFFLWNRVIIIVIFKYKIFEIQRGWINVIEGELMVFDFWWVNFSWSVFIEIIEFGK